jgi:hypothetical protein
MGTISRKPVTGKKEQHDRKLRKRSFGKAEMDGDMGSVGDQHEVDKSKQKESEESGEMEERTRKSRSAYSYITCNIFLSKF